MGGWKGGRMGGWEDVRVKWGKREAREKHIRVAKSGKRMGTTDQDDETKPARALLREET